MTPNDLIAGGYRSTKMLVHRFVDDLTPDEFRFQPVPGANSAAWIVGHLAVTLRRSAERLGATGLPAVDPGFVAKFAATKQAAGVQSDLGDPAELVRLFDVCLDKVTDAVATVSGADLDAPPPFKGPAVSTNGEAILFGAIHIAMHVGQLSAIRRSLGKPPAI